jgi:hypothetical protein
MDFFTYTFFFTYRWATMGRRTLEFAFMGAAAMGVFLDAPVAFVGVAFGFVVFSMIAAMIWKERMRMFDNLLKASLLSDVMLTGRGINLGKFFHPAFAGVLLFLAVFKTILAIVFVQLHPLAGLAKAEIFFAGLGMMAAIINTIAVLTELTMLCVIARSQEAELLSIATGSKIKIVGDADDIISCKSSFLIVEENKKM